MRSVYQGSRGFQGGSGGFRVFLGVSRVSWAFRGFRWFQEFQRLSWVSGGSRDVARFQGCSKVSSLQRVFTEGILGYNEFNRGLNGVQALGGFKMFPRGV